ncbi:MAG: MFS transporter [Dehalococcoidia bacterium]|nr:MFS transporter [Dehalococcoidia bacterium]
MTVATEAGGGEPSLARRIARRQFSSLAEYNYRVFFIGQAISQIGSWMQTVGQGWLVLQLTGSPTALGVVTMLQFLPFTLLSLVGGVLADRLPKRRTLIAVQLFATLQAVVLSAIVIADVVQTWHVYVLAFLLGTTNAIERPTRQSFFSELVSKERLVNAVALNSSVLNVARIVGPALGGVVIALFGVEGTFVLNAVSFMAVVCGYFLMQPARFYPPRRRASSGNIAAQIGEGIRFAATAPQTAFILMLVAFIGMFGYNFNVVIPLVARFVLEAGPERFGLLSSFLGAGALVSAFTIAGAGSRSPRFMVGAGLVFGASMCLLAASEWYWLSGAVLFGLGLSGAALMTAANTTLQLGAPDEFRGRIISIFILLQAGSTPIGGFITGTLSDAFGVQRALLVNGALCLAGVVVAVLYRANAASRAQLRADALPPAVPDEAA